MHETLPELAPRAGVAPRVAFVRLRSLGDTLVMTPAAAALKSWRPDVQLAIVVESRYTPLLEHNPDFETVITVPGGAVGRWHAGRALRRFRPQVALGLHGGSTAAALVRTSGAHHRATFLGLRHRWAYNLLTPPKMPPPGRVRLHAVEHVFSLLEALGLPARAPGPLRLAVRPEARRRMRERLAQRGLEGAYAFLNTEAREPGMRWPQERFAALAAWLRRTYGLASVQASAGAGEPVEGATLVSATSIEELMALEAEATLVAGNDGGPIHIAAALRKPTAVVYSTTDVEVWYPWQTQARWHQKLPIEAITLEQVQADVEALLKPSGSSMVLTGPSPP
ncbi:MAG: glycosyltransferase family 9 protein [Terriglobales bacterium]